MGLYHSGLFFSCITVFGPCYKNPREHFSIPLTSGPDRVSVLPPTGQSFCWRRRRRGRQVDSEVTAHTHLHVSETGGVCERGTETLTCHVDSFPFSFFFAIKHIIINSMLFSADTPLEKWCCCLVWRTYKMILYYTVLFYKNQPCGMKHTVYKACGPN